MKRYFLANFPQPIKQTEKRHNEIQGMFSRKKKSKTLLPRNNFLIGIKGHSWWGLKRYLNFVIFKYRLDQLFLDGDY